MQFWILAYVLSALSLCQLHIVYLNDCCLYIEKTIRIWNSYSQSCLHHPQFWWVNIYFEPRELDTEIVSNWLGILLDSQLTFINYRTWFLKGQGLVSHVSKSLVKIRNIDSIILGRASCLAVIGGSVNDGTVNCIVIFFITCDKFG